MALNVLPFPRQTTDPGLDDDWLGPTDLPGVTAPMELGLGDVPPGSVADITPPSSLPQQPRVGGPLGAISDVLYGIPAGAYETLASAGKMARAFTGGAPEIEPGRPVSLPREYGMAVGSSTVPMLLAAVGAPFGMVPGLVLGGVGVGVMGLAEAWDAYQRELRRQQEEEGKLDKAKALRKAALYGTGSTALELSVGRAIKPLGVKPSELIYGAARRFSGSESVARRALELAGSVAENIAEEASQRLLQDIIVEGEPTKDVLREAAMGGAVAPLALLFGRGAIRGASRLRELVTGEPSDVNVSRLIELTGLSAPQAADAVQTFSLADRAKVDASRILDVANRGEDILAYVTPENRRRIDRGEMPVFFNPSTGVVDGGALLHAALTALRESGGALLDPLAPIGPSEKRQILSLASTLADIAAADQLSAKHGQGVAERIIRGLRRQYEDKDVATGAVPALEGKPADQRPERAPEARAPERQGPDRQDQPWAVAPKRAEGAAVRQVSPALTEQKIGEKVEKLVASVLKQVERAVKNASQQAQQQAAPQVQQQAPQQVTQQAQQQPQPQAQAPQQLQQPQPVQAQQIQAQPPQTVQAQAQQQAPARPRIRILLAGAGGQSSAAQAQAAPPQAQAQAGPGQEQAQPKAATQVPRIRIRRPKGALEMLREQMGPLKVSAEGAAQQQAQAAAAAPQVVRVTGPQAAAAQEVVQPEKGGAKEEAYAPELGIEPLREGEVPTTVTYKLIDNAAILRRGFSASGVPTINLGFGTRPSSLVTRTLRASGFEYRPAQGIWTAIETPDRRRVLTKILKDARAQILSVRKEPGMILPSFEELRQAHVQTEREVAEARAQEEGEAERQGKRKAQEEEATRPVQPREYPEPVIRLPKTKKLEPGKQMTDLALEFLDEVVHNSESFTAPQLVVRETTQPERWRNIVKDALAEFSLFDVEYGLVSIGAQLLPYFEAARELKATQRGRTKEAQEASAKHLALKWLSLGHAFHYGGIQGLVTPELRQRLLQMPWTEPGHIGMFHQELERAVQGAAVLAHYAGLNESEWDSIRVTVYETLRHLVARFPTLESDQQWAELKEFLSNANRWPKPRALAESRVRLVESALPWALGPTHLRQYLRAAFNRMAVAATADPSNRWYGYLADALFRLLFSLETGIPVNVVDKLKWSNIYAVGLAKERGKIAKHAVWLEVRYDDPDGGGAKRIPVSIGMAPILQRLLRIRHARAMGRIEVAGEGATPFSVDARVELKADPPLVAVPKEFKEHDSAILAAILTRLQSRLLSAVHAPRSARMASQVTDMQVGMFATALTPEMLPWVNFVLRRTGQLAADGHNPMASGHGNTIWERTSDKDDVPATSRAYPEPSAEDVLRAHRWLKRIEAHPYSSIFWVPGVNLARWNMRYQAAGEQVFVRTLSQATEQIKNVVGKEVSVLALAPLWSAYAKDAWPGGKSPAEPPVGDPIADIMQHADGQTFDDLFGRTPEEPERPAEQWIVPRMPEPSAPREKPSVEPLRVSAEAGAALGAKPEPQTTAPERATVSTEPVAEDQPLQSVVPETLDAQIAHYGGKVLVRLDYNNLSKLAENPELADLIFPTRMPQAVLPAGAARGSTMTAKVVYAVLPASALRKLANILPGEYQTRDRAARAAQEEAVRIIPNLKPSLLLASESATTGAPIVDLTPRPDGTVPGVIAGNLRSIILVALAGARESHAKQYNAYVNAVRAFAEAYNVDITGIENPVLVRVAVGYEHPTMHFGTQYEAAAEFARLSNAQVGTSMSVAERASMYEQTILQHIGELEFTESGDLSADSLDRLVGWLSQDNLEVPRLTSKEIDAVTLNRIVRYVFLYNTMRAITEDAAAVYKMVDQIVSDDGGRRLLATFLRRLTGLTSALGRYANVRGPGSQDQVNIFGYGIRALLALYNVKPQQREEYARNNLLRAPAVLNVDPAARLERSYFTRQFAYLAMVAPDALPAILDDYIAAVSASVNIMTSAGSLFETERTPADDIAAGDVAAALHRIVKKHAPQALVEIGRDVYGAPSGHYEENDPLYSISLDQQLQYEVQHKTLDEFIKELEDRNPDSPVAYALRAAKRLGILDLLPGLKFAWARGLPGYAGLYVNAMRTIIFLGDESGYHFGVTAHELLHAIFTLLPEEKRLQIERLRQKALQRALRRNPFLITDVRVLARLQRDWGADALDVAVAMEQIPRAFYHLINTDEFFVWMLQGRAERELLQAASSHSERGMLASLYAWLRHALRRIASWAKEVRERFAGIRSAEEMRVANELWDAIVDGRYSVHGAVALGVPTEAVSYVARQRPIAPAPTPKGAAKVVPEQILQPISKFVESANRVATARIRQLLDEAGAQYSKLVAQESRWIEQARQLRNEDASEAERNMRDSMLAVANVLDIEALQKAGYGNIYEPEWLGRYWTALQDIANTYKDKQAWQAAEYALLRLRARFYAWTGLLYARDLAIAAGRVEVLERELAALKAAGTLPVQPPPNLLALEGGDEPYIPVAYPNYQERIKQLEAQLSEAQRQLAESEEALREFIMRHASLAAQEAIPNEVNPVADMADYLQRQQIPLTVDPKQRDPAVFREIFGAYVTALAQRILVDDPLAFEVRVHQHLLADVFLNAFATSDHRIAEIGLSEVFTQLSKALDALYNPPAWMREEQKRAIAAAFVKAVLNYGLAKEKAEAAYAMRVDKLRKWLGLLGNRLLARGRLKAVTEALEKSVQEAYGAGYSGYAAADTVNALLRFALTFSTKAKETFRQGTLVRLDRFGYLLMRIALAGMKSGLSDAQRRRFYTQRIASLISSLSLPGDDWWVSESQLLEQPQQEVPEGVIEEERPPMRVRWEDVPNWTGLSEEMLAVIMDMIGQNNSIGEALRGLILALSDKAFDSERRWMNDMLERLQRRMDVSKGPIDIDDLMADVVFLLEQLRKRSDPEIARLRKELFDVRAEIEAIARARAIWNSFTTQSFPRPDGTGDTPFWDVYYKALEVSQLSRVMAIVSPEQARQGSGAIVLRGFDLPKIDPNTGQREIVKIKDVVVTPAIQIQQYDTLSNELAKWYAAAVEYVQQAREAQRRYREYQDRVRALPADQRDAAGPPVPPPHELGFDVPTASGLENALALHSPYLFGLLWKQDTLTESEENAILAALTNLSFVRTFESLTRAAPPIVRHAVRIWMARWANMRLGTAKIVSEHKPKILAAKIRALERIGELDEQAYQEMVWRPLAELARQHGAEIREGMRLRTGHAVTKEDIELLKAVHNFHTALMRLAQKIHGFDPTRGTVEAVVGTFIDAGDSEFTRLAASVGTYELPRTLNEVGQRLIDKLAIALKQIDDDEELRAAFAEQRRNPEAFKETFAENVYKGTFIGKFMSVWTIGEGGVMADSYLADALEHRANIGISRSDQWINVLRLAAKKFFKAREEWMLKEQPKPTLYRLPGTHFDEIAYYVAEALIELGIVRGEGPALEETAAAVARMNIYNDLVAMSEAAVRAASASRFDSMATIAGGTTGRSFLNEFTKPAGTLWLPSAAYDYGAITDGQIEVAATRAQAYTMVQFMLAAARALRWTQEYEAEIELRGATDRRLLRQIRIMRRAMGHLVDSLKQLTSLAWTNKTVRDPLWLGHIKSTLLSDPVVTLRNLTLGAILIYMQTAQLMNASKLFALAVTFGSWARRAASFIYEMVKTGGKLAVVTGKHGVKLLRSALRKKEMREMFEAFLEDLADAATAETAQTMHRFGISISRRTAYMAYLTLLQAKIARSTSEYLLTQQQPLTRAGRLMRLGAAVRAATQASTMVLRSVGTELADTYLNAVALDVATWIERDLQKIVERAWERRLAFLNIADIKEFIASPLAWREPLASFKLTDEEISDYHIPAERAEHARTLREFYEEAGLNLDHIVYNKLREMARMYAQLKESGPTPSANQNPGQNPLGPKLEVELLDEEQRANIIRALARRFNMGDIVNRPIAGVVDATKRTMLTFMGYSINFLLQLVAYAVGRPGASIPERLLLALWRLFWLAVAVQLFAQISLFTTNRVREFLYRITPSTPSIFDREFWQRPKLAFRSLMFGTMLGLPLIGDLMAWMTGTVFGNRGWSLTDRVLAVGLLDNTLATIVGALKGAYRLFASDLPVETKMSGVVAPLYQLLQRYLWYLRAIEPRLSDTREAIVNFRNARALASNLAVISGVATEGRKVQPGGGRSDIGRVDATRQIIMDQLVAASANRDVDAFRAALQSLVAYFKEGGAVDPEQSAKAALQALNPLRGVVDGRNPTDEETAKILSAANDEQRAVLQGAIGAYEWAKMVSGSVLGGKAPVVGGGLARSLGSGRVPVLRIPRPKSGRLTAHRLASLAAGGTGRPIQAVRVPTLAGRIAPRRLTVATAPRIRRVRLSRGPGSIRVPRQEPSRTPRLRLRRIGGSIQGGVHVTPIRIRPVRTARRMAASEALRVPIGTAGRG